MTLRATLAERLGLVSATDAQRREDGEFWQVERPLRLGREVPAETPIERALRRSGASVSCGLRRFMPDPGAEECDWMGLVRSRRERVCAQRTIVGHTLVMAPRVRAMQSGRERCAGEEKRP